MLAIVAPRKTSSDIKRPAAAVGDAGALAEAGVPMPAKIGAGVAAGKTKLGVRRSRSYIPLDRTTLRILACRAEPMNTPITVSENYEALSQRAADRIRVALARKPNLLLCAAGGGSPARTYQLLVEQQHRDPAAFAALRVVKLDEWGGLPMDDPGSCETQLRSTLLTPLAISEDRCFGFRSDAADPGAECARVRQRLAVEGAIDLCVLGLGVNGHVAMNEPAPHLPPFAHVARLSEESLRHPMLAQSKIQPTHGLTLGLGEILASREILLLVSGPAKRAPLRRLLNREITTAFPASFLWLHPHWTLLCDREATAGLDLHV